MRIGMIAGIAIISYSMICNTEAQTNTSSSSSANQLPDIVITGKKVHEELLVGPYQQPEWTEHRRFPTTRVYIQDQPWNTEFEQWGQWKKFKDGTSEYVFQEELTLGLPYRFQFDLYDNWTMDNNGNTDQDSVATELRYAFADWGKIPMNPTIYLEYKFGYQKADAYEIKMLLGDQIAPRWHWGANIFAEQQTGDEEATETGISAALAYTILDDKLSIGLETEYAQESVENERSDPSKELLLGPSIQWRPTSRSHIDVTPLFGLNHDAPRIESYLVLGYDFGSIKSRGLKPKTSESR